MGQLTVDPGSVGSAAAVLRGADDGGVTMLARAIVDDVREGIGDAGTPAADVLSAALPQLVEAVGERTADLAGHLTAAADAYRRTDWVVHVALAAQR